MLFFINEILKMFGSCFSREAAYQWFVILVVGLMIRDDHLGVTSVIRDLGLRPECYETMMHFGQYCQLLVQGGAEICAGLS